MTKKNVKENTRENREDMEKREERKRTRKLLGKLAKDDFKRKFAGSYLGVIWAFVQPVITVMVYWFVFEKALGHGSQLGKDGITAPFVLWLIAGLVPWFFFSEAWSSGTNTLIDYDYLVKKVVFRIDILPLVKVISASFVHLFFVCFAIFLYACYGYFPDLYVLQVVYYTVCMAVLVCGLIYITSSIVVFFRDLSQIVGIVLQIGIWMTPIMWNYESIHFSPAIMKLLKLNPMFYIVQGYRDALINKVGFWEYPEMTCYFWLFALAMLLIGKWVFGKLKPHFADVL